jgi:hypothetical protein
MQSTAAVPDPKTRLLSSFSSYGSSSGATQLPRASVPRCTHRCKAARLLQPPQAIKPRLHTLLQANRLAKVSNERARLEIEVIVAKVVKDLRR